MAADKKFVLTNFAKATANTSEKVKGKDQIPREHREHSDPHPIIKVPLAERLSAAADGVRRSDPRDL